MNPHFLRRLAAEAAGTFFLVFCGTGAIVVDETFHGVVTHPGVAATFGLVVFALIPLFAGISGAHFNPAVSIGLAAKGLFPARNLVPYISAQLVGAAGASGALHLLFPSDVSLGATFPAGSEMQSFLFEFLLTFFLLVTIFRTSAAGISLIACAGAIGAVIGLEALFAGPVCGASMNPARSFGPALVSGNFHHLWLYIVAPVAGGIAAALFDRLFHQPVLSESNI